MGEWARRGEGDRGELRPPSAPRPRDGGAAPSGGDGRDAEPGCSGLGGAGAACAAGGPRLASLGKGGPGFPPPPRKNKDAVVKLW